MKHFKFILSIIVCIIIGSLVGYILGKGSANYVMGGNKISSYSGVKHSVDIDNNSGGTEFKSSERIEQKNNEKYTFDFVELLKENKDFVPEGDLFILIAENDASFKERLNGAFNKMMNDPDIIGKFQRGEFTPDYLDKHLPSAAKEAEKYIAKAPDEEFYQVYNFEYKALMKTNCRNNSNSAQSLSERASVKAKAVRAAFANPYNFKPISDEEFAELFKKIIKKYEEKGYDMHNFGIHFHFQEGNLSSYDSCETEKNFYDATFSLPKKETILFWRMMHYLRNSGN